MEGWRVWVTRPWGHVDVDEGELPWGSTGPRASARCRGQRRSCLQTSSARLPPHPTPNQTVPLSYSFSVTRNQTLCLCRPAPFPVSLPSAPTVHRAHTACTRAHPRAHAHEGMHTDLGQQVRAPQAQGRHAGPSSPLLSWEGS